MAFHMLVKNLTLIKQYTEYIKDINRKKWNIQRNALLAFIILDKE